MSQQKVGALLIDLSANVARLRSDMDEAKSVAGSGLHSIEEMAGSLKTTLGAVAAGFIGVESIKHFADLADDLGKVSKQSGLTVESLSALRYAAQQNDTEFQNVADGLKKLRVAQVEATQGNQELADLFGEIGVSVSQLRSMSPEDLFFKVADATQTLGTEQERTYLLTKLMGKSADELGSLMSNGATGIRQMMTEAERLGAVMSGETAEGIKASLDNIKALKTSSEALGLALMDDLAGPLLNITEAMKEAAKDGGILKAIWVGLGGSLAEIINIASNAKAIRDVNGEIADLEATIARARAQLSTGKFDPNSENAFIPDSLGLSQKHIEAIRKQLEQNIQELETLKKRRDKLLHPDAGAAPGKMPSTTDSAPTTSIGKPMTIDTSAIQEELSRLANQVDTTSAITAALAENEVKLVAEAMRKETEQAAEMIRNLKERAADGLASVEEYLKSDEERLKDSHDRRLEALKTAYGLELITKEQFEEDKKKLDEKYETERLQLWGMTTAAQLDNARELSEGLAGLAEATAGKQSGIYRAMFAVSKAFAIAESIVKIQTGIASAAALPFPANLGAMATVAASTASILTTIKGTQIQGVAHAGFDNIPREGTYLLNGGERIIAPKQNQDLTRFLNNSDRSSSKVTKSIVVNLNLPGVRDVDSFRKSQRQINAELRSALDSD